MDPKLETKAGHAPAVKVGNMRIKTHKHHSIDKQRSQSESEEELSISPKNPIISGAATKGDADFPPEAIKSFHEKPTKTSCDLRNQTKNNIIQQPKKF